MKKDNIVKKENLPFLRRKATKKLCYTLRTVTSVIIA